MYRVIRYFTDLQDNDYAYNVGDVFPRQGMSVSDERFAELASANNRQKTPLIDEVDDPAPESETAETTEENQAVEEKPKRRKRKAETE
jgi:hypothetical protein